MENQRVRKFRKKPATIEAAQWDGTREDAEAIRAAFGDAVGLGPLDRGGHTLSITTWKGMASARSGDWLIRGADRGVSVMTPLDFSRAYEVAETLKPRAGWALPAAPLCRESGEAASPVIVWPEGAMFWDCDCDQRDDPQIDWPFDEGLRVTQADFRALGIEVV